MPDAIPLADMTRSKIGIVREKNRSLTFNGAFATFDAMKLHGVIGLVLLISSELLLFKQVEIVKNWFYILAWWSYILIIDAVIFRLKGSSLMINRKREFFKMVPLSVFIWLVFELLNLRLKNWEYVSVTHSLPERWIGYYFAFATVLPGLFETAEFFELLIPRIGLRFPRLRVDSVRLQKGFVSFMLVGAGLCLLAILIPRYFFPAIWLGFIFMLDPLNYRFKNPSLLLDVQEGRSEKIVALLASGLLCGILWEFWNYWAQAKWVYSIAHFGQWKVFEMPLLGYLGFPPFALECFAMYHTLLLIESKIVSNVGRKVLLVLLMVFILVSFCAIDLKTVRSFAQNL